MLFFTNICIAVQRIDRARSMAMLTPPRMDMCAPSRICELRLPICDFLVPRAIAQSRSQIESLKSLRMPIGFLEASFADVFEEFIHRHQHYAGPFHVQPQIELKFIIEKMNVAVAEHTEERASGLEILGVNNGVFDGEFGVCFVGDAVSAAGQDVVQNS